MTTNNPNKSMSNWPPLSEEMERTLCRLAWRDEIFREALIANPKGVIQYLFHQSLPNGKLPDDLTIKVVEQDASTRHIVLPVLAEEEPTLEIAEEDQLDLIVNMGLEGGMRPRESDESKKAKSQRKPSITEIFAKSNDQANKTEKPSDEMSEPFPSTMEFGKMVRQAYQRDSKFRQDLKDNPTRAIESRFAQFFPDGKIPKERIYKVLQDAPDLHHLVLPSSRDESRLPSLITKPLPRQLVLMSLIHV